MLERRSALAEVKPYRSGVLRMAELNGFSLVQAAVFTKAAEKEIASITGKLPARVGIALEANGRILMRTGPAQFWFIGAADDNLAAKLVSACAVTPLSHSRTRIFLEGAPARDVLAKSIALDFHEGAFKPGMFAMTELHHTPVLVHCVRRDRFELYALRSFAVSIWDWLTDAALEFAD
ncbi:MAG: sarcosine oxidase subunit gamma [Hyphomicrobiales bacterium]